MSRRIVVFAVVVAGTLAAAAVTFRDNGRSQQTAAIADEAKRTAISVLVDVSESFAPFGQQDRLALQSVSKAIEDAARRTYAPKPITLWWFGITGASLLGDTPCGPAVEYQTFLTAPPTKGSVLNKPERLNAHLAECVEVVMRRSKTPSRYTDISGALSLVASSTSGKFTKRFLAIFSDFVEDHPSGVVPAEFRLAGERVVMIFRPEGSDKKNWTHMQKRLNAWDRRLRDAGASDVCQFPVSGVTHEAVAACWRGK